MTKNKNRQSARGTNVQNPLSLLPTLPTTDNLKGAMSSLKVILLTIRCRQAFRSTDARNPDSSLQDSRH